MKRTCLFLLSAILLVVLFISPAPHASAAGITCAAEPTVVPVGADVQITCAGFAPSTYTTAWFTSPSGVAFTWPGLKTDSAGSVTYTFITDYPPYFKMSLGQYAFTVKQNDLIGIAYFRVTGGTGKISGDILMMADPTLFTAAIGTTVVATGFTPFESVSVWFEFPNADCASMTAHGANVVNAPFGIGGGYIEGGLSSMAYATLIADATGNLKFRFEPFTEPGYYSVCLGEYHVVAEGNVSHRGGDIRVTMTGDRVLENAILTAIPKTVVAMWGTISFAGSGFGPNEIVNCWNTTPQGATITYDNIGFLNGPLKTDGNGNLSFSIFTGAFTPQFPIQSEGALGEWAMTCKGGASGRVGIARYTVTGLAVDP